MPKAAVSIYQTTKEFLAAHPGEYFTSESVGEGLNLKGAGKGIKISKFLAALAKGQSNGIERRQNDEGRFEYAFAGEPLAGSGQRVNKSATKARKSSARPPKRRMGKTMPRTQQPGKGEVNQERTASSDNIKKLANFIRAYLELSPSERRQALEWLKEQPA